MGDHNKTIAIGLNHQKFSFLAAGPDDNYLVHLRDGAEGTFTDFCRCYLRDDYVVFDLGANIGVTAAILSGAVPNGMVYAFEPGPAVYRSLAANVESNRLSNVRPLHLAISDQEGSVHFVENSAYGHINYGGHGVSVPTASIDSAVDSLGLSRLDFIKMDIEGFEWMALRGGVNSIRRYSPLIYLEFNSWCQIAYSKTNPVEFLDWLLDSFPFVYRVRRDGDTSQAILNRIKSTDSLSFLHNNLVLHGCIDDLVVTTDEQRLLCSGAALESLILRLARERHQAEQALINRLDKTRYDAEQAIAASKSELEAVYCSTSWRLTRPLRDLKRAGRRFW